MLESRGENRGGVERERWRKGDFLLRGGRPVNFDERAHLSTSAI